MKFKAFALPIVDFLAGGLNAVFFLSYNLIDLCCILVFSMAATLARRLNADL